MLTKSILAPVALALFAASSASAQLIFKDDFESTPPAGYTRTSGAEPGGETRFSNPGEPALGSRSIRFFMPDVDDGYGRVTLNAPSNAPIGKLRDINTSFDFYIDSTSDFLYAPYILLGLDNNGDGQYNSANESLIIQFSSSVAPASLVSNQWFNEVLNAANDVHVVVDRGQLAGGEFSPDATPDKLGALYDTDYSATTKWGDLNVFRVRVAAGFFAAGAGNQDYTAYVDNVAAVPEPSTAVLLGMSALALGLRRNRRRSA